MESTTVMIWVLLIILWLQIWDRVDKQFQKRKVYDTTGKTTVGNIVVKVQADTTDFHASMERMARIGYRAKPQPMEPKPPPPLFSGDMDAN